MSLKQHLDSFRQKARRAGDLLSLATLDAVTAYTVTGNLGAAVALVIAPLLVGPLKILPR